LQEKSIIDRTTELRAVISQRNDWTVYLL